MRALAVFLALFWSWTATAVAWPVHYTLLPNGACPQGAGLGDGCPQNVNPGGTFLYNGTSTPTPNAWSAYARASNQTWNGGATHPWAWNAPGIDYAIGPWTPQAQLKDPMVQANLPPGCGAVPGSNHIGGPAVWCGGAQAVNVVLSGFEFGAAFGHGCVQIIVQTNATGTFTVQNSHFKNGPGCTVTDAVVVGSLDSQTNPTQLTVNSLVSGTVVNGDLLIGGDIDKSGTINSGTFPTYNVSIGGCENASPPNANCDTTPQTYYIGRVLDAYIQIQFRNPGLTGVLLQNNTFDGDGANQPMSYTTAFINNGAAQGFFTFKYNAFVHIPARVITSSQQAGSLTFQYNYFEDFCYNEVDFHCEIWFHVLNQNVTFDSTTVSYNVFLSGKDKHTWPGGTAYAWLGTGNSGVTNPSIVTNTQFDHNIMVSNCVPNGASGNAGPTATPCNGNFYANHVDDTHFLSSQLLTALQDRLYVNSSFTSNYYDSTGTVRRVVRQGQSACTNPTVFAGNIDLTTGLPVNAFDAGGGGGGC